MKATMTRRELLACLAGVVPILSAAKQTLAAAPSARKRLGICNTSYGIHWKAARNRHLKAKFKDALEFLEYCHQLGAGGVQLGLGSREQEYAAKFHAKTEALEMYYEGQIKLPQDASDRDRFETDLRLAKITGAEVVRAAMLSGRRYETFDSAEAFRRFAEQSGQSLTLAEPILRKHRIRLAIENHKDWRIPELLDLLKKISSQHIGVCVDTGNSIALLEDPMEVIRAFAPFAYATHIKDMAVQEYYEGFLLSEVPLGEGFLDLKEIISLLDKANPRIQFTLEMITRDPLKVPCLTPKYWATMESVPASQLVEALRRMRKNGAKDPLPQVTGLGPEQQIEFEDKNVRDSLAYARQKLGL